MPISKLLNKIQSIKPGAHHATGPGGLSLEAFANWYRDESLIQWQNLDIAGISKLAKKIIEAEKKNRNIFVMGNGGSAATASHWATDFSKTARVSGRPFLKCQSLSENMAYLTAIANDVSFDDSFSLQLESILTPNDIVILISGSGNSKNLIKACLYTKKRKAFVIGLLGFNGGRLKNIVDLPILVPSEQYGVIEDMHMAIGHIVTFYLKQRH
jgi:D-sedoheptulose 7-phosphate isomerase